MVYQPQWIELVITVLLALPLGYWLGAGKTQKKLLKLNRELEKYQQDQQHYDTLKLLSNDLIIDWHIQSGGISADVGITTKLGEGLEQPGKTIKDWHDRVHPDDIHALEAALQTLMNGIGLQDRHKYRVMCSDGFYATVQERCLVLRNEGNQALTMLRTIVDVSEEQLYINAVKCKAKIQKSEALITLVDSAAHDYNNVFGIVSGYLELLTLNLSEDDKLVAYTNQIDDAVQKGLLLSTRLLTYSRRRKTGQGKVVFDRVATDIIEQLSASMVPGIIVECDLACNANSTVLDTEQLALAINNLVNNSVAAMEHEGLLSFTSKTVSLSSREAKPLQLKSGRYINFDVQDSGCGMDEKTIELMFDPYFTTGSGSGLGLSQVFGFILSCDGGVDVCSRPDRGCTVRLYFPLR